MFHLQLRKSCFTVQVFDYLKSKILLHRGLFLLAEVLYVKKADFHHSCLRTRTFSIDVRSGQVVTRCHKLFPKAMFMYFCVVWICLKGMNKVIIVILYIFGVSWIILSFIIVFGKLLWKRIRRIKDLNHLKTNNFAILLFCSFFYETVKKKKWMNWLSTFNVGCMWNINLL